MESVIAVALLVGPLVVPQLARADVVDDETQALSSAPSYKRRLAAVLTLSKVHEARAVRALAVAMERDADPKLRQIAALALAKAMTDDTPVDARKAAFDALHRAQAKDKDDKVRDLAQRTLTKLAALELGSLVAPPPAVFVYVASATDGSSKAPADSLERMTLVVRGAVVRRAPELATQWPGSLPTEKDLGSSGTKAYSVAANVAAIEIVQRGGSAEITCKVQVRVQPWNGVDGAERWVAHKAASASGEGKASTAANARAIAGGIRDCVTAVAEEVTTSQVVPFLRKVVAST